jgi:signal recognition particle GTPase
MEGSSFFQRLKQGLTKSRESWVQKIAAVVQNRRWDETSIADMEESLIAADVGVKATRTYGNLAQAIARLQVWPKCRARCRRPWWTCCEGRQ